MITSFINNKSALYLPMKIVQIYLSSVLLLYIFGPIDWQTRNPFLLYSFLIIAQISLFWGYKSSLVGINSTTFDYKPKDDGFIIKYLNSTVVLSLIFTILSTIRNTGMSTFSMSGLLEKVSRGFMDPGKQYYEKFDSAVFGGSLLTYTLVVLSPFLWIVIPLSIYYFKKLFLINKILALLTIFIEATRWIATGTNKGIIDLILIVSTVVFIKALQRKYYNKSQTKFKFGSKLKIYIPILLLFIIGVLLFFNAIDSRVGGVFDGEISGNKINPDALFMKLFPNFILSILIYSTSYLTQGYYALSLALTEPFHPMFGIGNSMFLIENFNKIFSYDFYQLTYQSRLEYLGWDPLANWHSIYIWIANDLSFFGIFPLLYVLGNFFGNISKDAIINKNPIAYAIFCLLVLMFFYFPMNNQILSYPTTFSAFWGLALFWLIQKSEYLKKIKFK